MKLYKLLSLLFLLSFISLAQTAPPTDLTATLGGTNTTNNRAVLLAWQYAPGTTMIKYNVYKKTGPLSDTMFHFMKIATVSSKTFTDYNVTSGKKYSYYVTAVVANIPSLPSNIVEIEVTPIVYTYGKISGTVLDDSTLVGVRMGTVYFVPKTGGMNVTAKTDSNGIYGARLKTGQYYIRFVANRYYSEYYDNVIAYNQATLVTLAENDSLIFNAGLKPFGPPPPPPVLTYGKISGKLFADGTLLPVKRGTVNFIPKTTINTCPSYSVMTDTNGNFTAKLKTGQYYIRTAGQGYVPEFYDNVASVTLATLVTLNAADSLIFNIGLAAVVPPVFYTVTGSVKNETGLPVKAELNAYRTATHVALECGLAYHARTDSNGNFTFTIKENDTIVIYIAPVDHALLPQYYNNKTTFAQADKIAVNANVTGIDVIIHAKPVYANGITGTVKDSAGIVIPKFGMVYIYSKSNGHLVFKGNAKTDTVTGIYNFVNLPPAQYYLYAQARNYRGTYFTYSGIPTMDWRHADSVVVTETGVVGDINFYLKGFAPHTHNGVAVAYGIVTGEKEILEGAINFVVDQNNEIVDCAVSEVDGSYMFTDLPSGNYTLVSTMLNYNDSKIGFEIAETGTQVAELNVTLTPLTVTGVNDNNSTIKGYALNQNYPNPFNPATVISYQIPQNSLVTVKVYNVLGSEIVTLVNEQQSAGKHYINFNAANLSSGVYLYKIQAGEFSAVKKLTLIK